MNYSAGFLRRQQKLTKNLQLVLTLISKIDNKEERKKYRQIIKRQFLLLFPDEELPGLKIQEKILSNHTKKTRQNGGGTTLFTPLEQP